MYDESRHLARQDGPPIDPDPVETAEWRDALSSMLEANGPGRVRQILDMLAEAASDPAIGWRPPRNTPYVNTIAVEAQPPSPAISPSRNGWPR